MAVRLTSNENPWTREHPTYQDLNDTFDAALTLAAVGAAQNAYQTLQANDVFDNKDFLAADEFTDSTGTNNTVTTGTTTSAFSVDSYLLPINNGTGGDINATVANLASFSSDSTARGLKITALSNCYLKSITKHSSVTATRAILRNSSGTTIESASFSSNTATFSSGLYIGVTYFIMCDNSGGAYASYRTSTPSDVTDSSQVDIIAGGTGTSSTDTSNYFNITTITTQDPIYSSSSIVTCDSNTLTLDGTEKSILVYADKTLNTGGSMTVDISDGSTTLSAQSLNTLINISSLSSGTIELIFNLATSDTDYTPEFYGYGVYIYK